MPIVVSEANAEETLQAYAHPLSIQAKAISDFENRLLDGDVVADGNNVFTYLTEFASNMTAGLVQKACACFNSLYPENAQTATDLYKHLSDFDYIGLFATPAEMTVELVFDRNFLIDNAIQPDGCSYYKIIIPEYSKFTIGEYKFGLMYPIEVRVRKAPLLPNGNTDYDNSAITVMWDTTNQNPLKTLESHILEHRDFVQNGQTLTAIEVPIYQFEVESHLEDAIASTGFAKRYDYLNKFYAIRVFHFKNGKWNEMAQTLSDINYDVDVPTAMIKVLMDIGKVEVVIPQIYFNSTKESSVIGNRILVKIYHTQGELNLDLSSYDIEQYSASFLMTDTILVEDDTYSNMLKRIPTIYILPATKRIASGTDGITMDELKERVKHDASYTVKITTDDLDAYFATSGFTFTKELDNITDRVFCAHKVLTDGTGTTIAAGQHATYFSPEMLDIEEDTETGELYVPNYSSISVTDSKNITISPSAIFKYNEDEERFEMLSDDEISVFQNQTVEDQITELNNNLFTYTPFHIKMSLDPELPIAGSYDFYDPKLKSIVFSWENPNTTVEISIYTASIEVLKTDDTGYRLSVALFKTANISDVKAKEQDGVDINNIHVMLSTTNSDGAYLYMLGTYNGQDDSGHDVFVFDIKSTFKLTDNDMINVLNMYDASGSTLDNYIDIDSHAWQISFFIKSEFVTDSDYPMEGVSQANIPGLLDDYVYLCKQEFKLTLGKSLPLLKNDVTIGTTDQTYQTYPTTQFDTYNSDVYDRWSLSDYNTFNLTTDTKFIAKNSYYTRAGSDPYYTYTRISMYEVGQALPSKDLYVKNSQGKYVKTTDTTAQDKQVYYATNSDGDYVLTIVTAGADVPANTCYVRLVESNRIGTLKLIQDATTGKYSPVIKHAQGDVIISSPYNFDYGPVFSMTTKDSDGETITSSHTLDKPYTVTSAVTNVWNSITDNIYVGGAEKSDFVGMYRKSLTENNTWWQTTTSLNEVFDTSTLIYRDTATVTIYKVKEPSTGRVLYATSTVSPTGEAYEIIKENHWALNDDTKDLIFRSSNCDEVKADSYVKSKENTRVNTTARGKERKWYLYKKGLTDDRNFSFDTYTGFVVEYTVDGVDNTGTSKAWCLNFWFQTTDPDTGMVSNDVILIASGVDTEGKFDANDAAKMKDENDGYIAAYETSYHALTFVTETGFNGWKLGVASKKELTGVQYWYKANVVGTAEDLRPWEAEWEPIDRTDTSKLLVTCVSNDNTVYQTKIKDALGYIIDYLKANDNKLGYLELKSLNLYVDKGTLTEDEVFLEGKAYYTRVPTSSNVRPYEYEAAEVEVGEEIPANTYYEVGDERLVDPLEGAIFAGVSTTTTSAYEYYVTTDTVFQAKVDYFTRSGEGTIASPYVYTKADVIVGEVIVGTYYNRVVGKGDGRSQEYCNSLINYISGVSDPVFPERALTVGTADGEGAVYYRDPTMTAFDYSDYNLTLETVIAIITAWDKYRVYSEKLRYEWVVKETGISLNIVKLIVSETEPSMYSPWKRLVNMSSFSGLKYYYENRKIVNCPVTTLKTMQDIISTGYSTFENLHTLKEAITGSATGVTSVVYVDDITTIDETAGDDYSVRAKDIRAWLELEDDEHVADFANRSLLGTTVSPTSAFVSWKDGAIEYVIRCGYNEDTCKDVIMSYSVSSGFLYVMSKQVGTTYVDTYINYASKLDRTYTTDDSSFTLNELNINFENSIWAEVDKWPWELEVPWFDASTGKIADITIAYNYDVSCAKVLHANTDIMVDSDGNPIIATNGSRDIVYTMDMIHCDYKLTQANDTDYVDYITDVRELMRSYFNEINTVSPSLLARTKLYFSPIRTFGNAKFKGNGGNQLTLPIEFSIDLCLHVEAYVNGSDLNKDTIKNSILTLVDTRLKEGMLNLAVLAKDIMNELSDNIICVDVLGINGNSTLQTMIPVDADCSPQLKQILVLNDDGSVHATRALNLTWSVIE